MTRVPLFTAGLLLLALAAPLSFAGTLPEAAVTDAAREAGAATTATGALATADDGPLAPEAVTGVTLPNQAGAFNALVFDDFEWCASAPCAVTQAAPQLGALNGFSYSVTPSDSWLVSEASEGEGYAIRGELANGVYEVNVRKTSQTGVPMTISFDGKGPVASSTGLVDGGLELQVTQRVAGAVVGPVPCQVVPAVPAADGYWTFVAANPGCMVAPAAMEIWLHFVARAGIDGSVPEIAIDNLLIEQV